jgi:hypothetical protein
MGLLVAIIVGVIVLAVVEVYVVLRIAFLLLRIVFAPLALLRRR